MAAAFCSATNDIITVMAGVHHRNRGATDYVCTPLRLPKELVGALEEFAREHRLSRNSAVVFMISAFLDSGTTGRRIKRMTRGNNDGYNAS